MLTKCANPECNARFRYLHEGRLFIVDRSDGLQRGPFPELSIGETQRLDYYWLCGTCSRSMSVVWDREAQVHVLPTARAVPPSELKSEDTGQ